MRKTIIVAATAAVLSVAVSGAHAPSMKHAQAHQKKRITAKRHQMCHKPRKAVHNHLVKPHMKLLSKLQPALLEHGLDMNAVDSHASARRMAVQQQGSMMGSGNNGGSYGSDMTPPPFRKDEGELFNGENDEKFAEKPHCNSTSRFGALISRYYEACGRVDFSFIERPWRDAGKANQAYEAFCTSPCASAMNSLLTYTEGYNCVENEMINEFLLTSAMCQYDTQQTDLRCGAKLAASGIFEETVCQTREYQLNKAKCNNAPGCEYSDDTNSCDDKFTTSRLDIFCSDCARRINSIFQQGETSFDFCVRHNNQYCFTQFIDIAVQATTSNDTNAFLNSVCSGSGAACFRYFSAASSTKLITARETFNSCIKTSQTFQWYDNSTCLNQFNADYQRELDASATIENWCVRNSTGASGVPCAAKFAITSANRGADWGVCPNSHFSAYEADGSCSSLSECGQGKPADRTADFIASQGCCLPFRTRRLTTPAAALPWTMGEFSPEQLSMNKKDEAVSSDSSLNMTGLLACSGATVPDQSNCEDPWAITQVGTWNTNLLWATIRSSAKNADLLRNALQHDAAKATGVFPINVIITWAAAGEFTDVTISVRGTATTAADAKKFFAENPASTRRTDNLINGDMCEECAPRNAATTIRGNSFLTIPGAPQDPCTEQAFTDSYQLLLAACNGPEIDAMFGLEGTISLQTANAAWEQGCTSQCLTRFRELRATDYGVCIPPEILSIGDIINVGCAKDNQETARCGAVLSVMNAVECSVLDEETCVSLNTTRCRWSAKRQSCRDEFTESFLAPICDSGCITKLAATIGGNKDGFAQEARLMDTMFCSVDYDESNVTTRCLPHIQRDINAIDDNNGMLSNATIVDFCETDRKKLRCMKRIYSAIAIDTVSTAEYVFYDCVDSVLDNNQVSVQGKVDYISQYCIGGPNGLATTLTVVDGNWALLNNMCAKNEAGVFCMHYVNRYQDGGAQANCLNKLIEDYECSSTCKPLVEDAFTNMGCCVANLQEVYGFLPFENLPEEDLPEFEAFENQYDGVEYTNSDSGSTADATNPPATTTAMPNNNMNYNSGSMMGSNSYSGSRQRSSDSESSDSPDPTASRKPKKGTIGGGPTGVTEPLGDDAELIDGAFAKFDFFANYDYCENPTLNINNLLYRKCKKPKATASITRTLDIGASKDSLAGTAKKEKRFLKKLIGDIGNRQGGTRAEYSGTGVAQKTTTSGGRRQTTGTSSVSFTYTGETAADTNAAANSYDNAVSSGSLTLSSTVTLVKNECGSNCSTDATSVVTTAEASTLTSEFAPTPTPTPEPTTGAAAASVLAALCAAIAALVF